MANRGVPSANRFQFEFLIFPIGFLLFLLAGLPSVASPTAEEIAAGAQEGTVSVFATSIDLPLIRGARCFAVDDAGVVWLGVEVKGTKNDRVMRLLDVNGDGRAEIAGTFAHKQGVMKDLRGDEHGVRVRHDRVVTRLVDLDGDGRSDERYVEAGADWDSAGSFKASGTQVMHNGKRVFSLPGAKLLQAKLVGDVLWLLERTKEEEVRLYRAEVGQDVLENLRAPAIVASASVPAPPAPPPAVTTPATSGKPELPEPPGRSRRSVLPETLHPSLTADPGRIDYREKQVEKLAAEIGRTKAWTIALLGSRITGEKPLRELALYLDKEPRASVRNAQSEFVDLVRESRDPLVRRFAFRALLRSNMAQTFGMAGTRIDWLSDVLAALVDSSEDVRVASRDHLISLFRTPPVALKADRVPRSVIGKRVRITVTRNEGGFALAELEVVSGGRNVAGDGLASQSSTGYGRPAKHAIDGNQNGHWASGTQSHTAPGGAQWWQVELPRPVPVQSVSLWGRTDCCWERIGLYDLEIFDAGGELVFATRGHEGPRPTTKHEISGGKSDVIEDQALELIGGVPDPSSATLSLLLGLLETGRHPHRCAEVLSQIDLSDLRPPGIVGLAQRLFAVKSKMMPMDPVVLNLDRCLENLRARVGDGSPLARQLDASLRQVVRLICPLDGSGFQPAEVRVRAGRPVLIQVMNLDHDPHNLVIGQPGLTSIQRKELIALGVEGKGRAIKHDLVLASLGRLGYRKKATLEFIPAQKGGCFLFSSIDDENGAYHGNLIAE